MVSPPPAKKPRASVIDNDRIRAKLRVEQMEMMEDQSLPRPPQDPEVERQIMAITTRTGGAYIPPAKLRALKNQLTDKQSEAYQRMSWEALKKSINGLVNKVNMSNIKNVTIEVFAENLVRGRGIFCRSMLQAQHASPTFTTVYAALIAIVNTKLPSLGELVLTRVIAQFQRSYRRNDKPHCLSTTKFIAHLVNQQVAHELLALQILAVLLERPTDDSVEVAVGFLKEVGACLTEVSPRALHATFERFRSILHESQIDKRVQYMIEVLFQIRKEKFRDFPIKPEELDVVEEDDQITHFIGLDAELDVQEKLDVFKMDSDFVANEEKYNEIKVEILGGSDEEDSDEEKGGAEEGAEHSNGTELEQFKQEMRIQDETDTNMINLRRTIYLTIMSSLDYEECCHKLLRLTLKPGQEKHLCEMVIECCSQERTYEKFFGMLGERFCKINSIWADNYCTVFVEMYATIHRYETNRIRNIAKFYGHLLQTDSIPWMVLECLVLSEEDTTSSSRIFVKILMLEMCETLGLEQLKLRFNDEYLRPHYAGLFPTDNPKNMRFAINYFTSIGLGGLTDDLRDKLKALPKLVLEKSRRHAIDGGGGGDSESSSGSEDGESGESGDESD